jgi:uncharacterized protein (TIGR03067 family)
MGRRSAAAVVTILIAATAALTEEPRPLPKDLQGQWAAVALEFSGRQPPGDIVSKYKVVVRGDKIAIDPLSIFEGRFTTDGGAFEVRCEYNPGASPKAIDLIFKNGDDEIRMLGIYAVEGKRLKICWQHDGKARPTEFKTKAEPSQMLVVLERPKKE